MGNECYEELLAFALCVVPIYCYHGWKYNKRVSEISYMCHSETDPQSQFSHQLLPCHHHFLWCCPKSFQWPTEISLQLWFLQYYFKWHHQSPFPPGKHVRFPSGTASQISRTTPLVADDMYSGFLVGQLGYFPGCGYLGKMSTQGRHWDSQGMRRYLKAEGFSHKFQERWPLPRRKATAQDT